jgi:hypothetical protein
VLVSRLLGYYLEHVLNHLVSREDAMLAAVLLEHTLVRLSCEDAMFAGVLPEHALVHVESGDDAMFAGDDDVMLAGMLLENPLVHIASGEDAMHLLVTDQGVLLEHSYPSWPTRASC